MQMFWFYISDPVGINQVFFSSPRRPYRVIEALLIKVTARDPLGLGFGGQKLTRMLARVNDKCYSFFQNLIF